MTYAASQPATAVPRSAQSVRPNGTAVAPRATRPAATARPVLPWPPTTATRTARASDPVDVGVRRTVGQGRVARAAVEERVVGAAPRLAAGALGSRGIRVEAEVAGVPRAGEDHSVVTQRGLRRDLAPDHVAHHELRVARQRVAPAATTRRPDADDLAGLDRLGVGEGVDLALVGPARVDDDLERRAGPAAPHAPAREDRAVGDRHEVGVPQHPDVLLVAQPAAE